MHYNCSFDTYRTGLSGGKRTHSLTKTLDSKDGYLEIAGSDVIDVLGIDDQSEIFMLITDETDIRRDDKVVISSENYAVTAIRKMTFPKTITEVTLIKQKA